MLYEYDINEVSFIDSKQQCISALIAGLHFQRSTLLWKFSIRGLMSNDKKHYKMGNDNLTS